MRDLLDNQDSLASTVLVWPESVEEFSHDWVEWLSSSALAVLRCSLVSSPSSRIPSSHFGSTMSAPEYQGTKDLLPEGYSQCTVP